MSEESEALVCKLAAAVIGLPFPQIRHRWAGVYDQLSSPSDDELYLRREVTRGVVVVTGVGGRGMTISPAVASETFA